MYKYNIDRINVKKIFTMLECLNAIEWQNIKHAFGTAEKIPDLIRELVSEDRSVREATSERLLELINHQGSLYEASVYVAPCLIELLTYEKTPDKGLIFGILQRLINPNGGFQPYSELTYQEIRKHLKTFQALLKHPDQEVRIQTAITLSFLWEDVQKTGAWLIAAIEEERNEEVKGGLMLYLKWLVNDRENVPQE